MSEAREELEDIRTSKYRWDEPIDMEKEIARIIKRIIEGNDDLSNLSTKDIKNILRKKLGGVSLAPYKEFIKESIIRECKAWKESKGMKCDDVW